jgi:hypothetical protein
MPACVEPVTEQTEEKAERASVALKPLDLQA